jgi:hypothetical protein
MSANSFVVQPRIAPRYATTSSSSQLFVIRKVLRRFNRNKQQTTSSPAPIQPVAPVVIEPVVPVVLEVPAPSPPVATLTLEPIETHAPALPGVVETDDTDEYALKESDTIYTLPPVDRDLTALELEFRNMLQSFANYTDRDILSLRDPRTRILFEGVAASASEPAVFRAFEVLFEDLYPLRVAGRIIYKKLQDHMETSIKERSDEIKAVIEATDLPEQKIEAVRLLFVSTAAQLNGDAYLTLDQLATTGLAQVAVDILQYESVHDLLETLDKKKIGKLSFYDLVVGLNECAQEQCGLDKCDPAAVMRDLLTELQDNPPNLSYKLDKQRQVYAKKYDDMVAAFINWKDRVPQKESNRRIEVIRGCFVGAENKKVVDALKIVYVDYAALRIAGDFIFNLVSTFMGKASKQ